MLYRLSYVREAASLAASRTTIEKRVTTLQWWIEPVRVPSSKTLPQSGPQPMPPS
jgi:hypothetical protein